MTGSRESQLVSLLRIETPLALPSPRREWRGTRGAFLATADGLLPVAHSSWQLVIGIAAVTILEGVLIGALWLQIVRRRRSERALKDRLSFEELMRELLGETISVSHDQSDARIKAALTKILEILHLDFAALLEVEPQESLRRVTHYAQVNGAAHRQANVSFGDLTWVCDQLQSRRAVAVADVAHELPECATAERRLAREYGMKSLFVAPVMTTPRRVHGLVVGGGNGHGSIAEVQARLGIVGEILGGMLARGQADEALRSSEERSRAILRAVPDLFFVFNREGVYVDYHVADPGALFVPPAQFLGKNFREVLPPEIAEQLAGRFGRVLATHEVQLFEYTLPIDGTERTFEARLAPLGPDQVLSVIREISDRKGAEAALRASDERYRAVVETQTELVCRYLPDTTLTFVNDAYCRYFGSTREQMLGRKFLDFIPAVAREAARSFVDAMLREPGLQEVEHQVISADGSVRWQHWVDRVIYDSSGHVVELQGIGRDVTARRQMQEALQESERRRRMATAAGGVGVWDWNLETGEITTDPILKELLGCSDADLPNTAEAWKQRVHPVDLVNAQSLVRAHLEGRTARAEVEVRLKHKDGTYRWFQARGTVIRDPLGRPRVLGTSTDITERKRSAEGWRQSEARLRRLGESNVVGLAISDRAGRIYEANDEYLRIIAQSRADMLAGKANFWERVPPERREACEAFLDELSQTGIGRSCQWEYVRADGTRIATLIGAVRLDDEDDRSLTVVVDVSRQKEAELALRESEERYTRATSAAGVGVWDWDLTTNAIFIDPALKSVLGFREHEIENHMNDWGRRMHPADVTPVAAKFEAHLRRADPVFDVEYRMIHKDGSLRWFLSRGTVQRDASGKAIRMIGTNTDITERKNSEEAARESERRFQTLADAAPVLIWMSGPDRLFTYVNRGWLRFTGRTISDETGKGWIDRVHPEDVDACLERYYTAFYDRRPFTIEYRFKREDGEYRWFLNHGVPRSTRDGAFLGYIGSCLDITERKKDEAELHQSRQELVHLSRVSSLGALSSALAHELNQPLGAILSNAQAALRYLDHQPPNLAEVREILQDIAVEDQRAGDVIRHMRLLLKRGQPQFVPLEFNPLVNDVLWLMRSEMMHRGTTIEVLLDSELPSIPGDHVQLQQVLINLLLNGSEAMQHLPANQRKLRVRTYHRENIEIGVDVSDVGLGIKSDDMRRLFAPFFTTKKQGLGVGLAICKSIIDAHGGRLWAENNLEHGATFHVVLPVTAP